MFKAVIFDFDGTLANTIPDLTTGINLMRAHYGYGPVTETDVLGFINGSTHQYIEHAMPPDFPRDKLDEAVDVYIEGYSKHYLDKTAPYAGVPEMLDRLRADGVPLIVFSNKDNVSVGHMVETLFPGVFDATWGTVDGVPAKPDPTRAWMIARELGLRPEEIAYVGDSDVDMLTSGNAGTRTIGVSWGYRDEETLRRSGAVAIAHTPDELYEILKQG